MNPRPVRPSPSEPTAATPQSPSSSTAAPGRPPAMRVVVATFGVLAALAGVEHGLGEVRQGPGAPQALVIESWPDSAAFAIVGGEPAMTLVPDLVVGGLAATAVALALGVWAVWFVGRRHGPAVLIALSVALLLVGGGFGPPLIGVVLGFAARGIGRERPLASSRRTRALARLWPWALGVGVAGYLSLVPGTVLLSGLAGVAEPGLVAGLVVVAFGSLGLALVAARTRDRLVVGGE